MAPSKRRSVFSCCFRVKSEETPEPPQVDAELPAEFVVLPQNTADTQRQPSQHTSQASLGSASLDLVETVPDLHDYKRKHSPVRKFKRCLDRQIKIKSGESLGLTFRDKVKCDKLFVENIVANSPAYNAALKVGDKLLTINGLNLRQLPYGEALRCVEKAGDRFAVRILREVIMSSCEEIVEVTLRSNEDGLGFSVTDDEDGLIYISELTPDTPADVANQIQVGDQLLEVNGEDVTGFHPEDVEDLLTDLSNTAVQLTLCRTSDNANKRNEMTRTTSDFSDKGTTSFRSSDFVHGSEPIIDKGSSHRPISELEDIDIKEIVIIKQGGPLGLCIIGGTDRSCHPFGEGNPGIFISKIFEDGCAAGTGLCMGDRLLLVNGEDVTQCTHEEVVKALVQSVSQIRLQVKHESLPAGFLDVMIPRSVNEKIGLSISGGADCDSVNTEDLTDEGLFITKISEGAVSRDGRIRVGHRIIEVNGKSMLGATQQDVVKALRQSSDMIQMIVCDGIVLHGGLSPVSKSTCTLDDIDDDYHRIQEEEEALREEREFEEEMERMRLDKERQNKLKEQEAFDLIEQQLRHNAVEKQKKEEESRQAEFTRMQREGKQRARLRASYIPEYELKEEKTTPKSEIPRPLSKLRPASTNSKHSTGHNVSAKPSFIPKPASVK